MASALLGVGATGVVLSWFGWYQPAVVLIFGLAAGYTLFSLREGFDETPRWSFAGSWPALAALAVAAAAAAFIALYPSEPLLAGDPAGAVLIDAQLLAEEGSARFDALEPEWGNATVALAAPGYEADASGRLRSASPPFPAAVVAAVGWLGNGVAFRVGAGVAAIALLAFYAFAARVLRPWTAAIVTAALAANPAFVHLARDQAAAVAVLAMLAAGLALLWDDHDAPRPRRAVLAGIFLGSVVLVDFPWLLLAAPVAAWAAHELRAARTLTWTAERRRLRFLAAFAAGYVPAVVAGLVSAWQSAPDLIDGSGVAPGWVVAAVLLAGVVGYSLPSGGSAGRTGAALVAVLVLAGGVLLGVVRPLIAEGTSSPSAAVAEVQAREGVPVDATRTYAEDAGLWQAWYAGPVAVGAGLVGWAALAGSFARDGAGRRRPIAFLFAGMTVVWLARPGIDPIHIEVMRRFLPLTIPGLLLGAGWLAEKLWIRRPPLEDVSQTLAIGIVAGALAFPGWFLVDTWDAATQRGGAARVDIVCTRLGNDAAVVVVGDRLAGRLPVTLRAHCGLPAAGATAPVTTTQMQALADRWDASGRRLLVLSDTETPFPGGGGPGAVELPRLRYTSLERRVEDRPRASARTVLRVFLSDFSG